MLALAGLLGCAAPRVEGGDPSADAMLMFVDVEGSLDELRSCGASRARAGRGDGPERRYHIGATVRRRSALRVLVVVRVVLDEAEREAMERAAS